MNKTLLSLLVSAALILPSTVHAESAMSKALSVIPADAVGFICVPNVKELDADFQNTVQKLGLGGMIAPPFNSLSGVLNTFLHVDKGFDPNGAVAVVIMPANNWMEMLMKQALIIPATDARTLLESMGAKAGEDGVWSLTINSQPAVAAAGNKYIVLAQMSDVAKAVAAGKKTAAATFNKHDLEALDGLDFVVWLNGVGLVKAFRPQIDQGINMITMMQRSNGAVGAAQSDMTKKQLTEFVDGVASIGIGVGLGADGLTMRMGFRATSGSELASSMKLDPTSESLLRGLPGDNYLFALGATMDPAAVAKATEQMDGFLAMAEKVEGIDLDQAGKLKGVLKEWAPMSTGIHAVVTALAPGAGGVFGVALVFDTGNSARWTELFATAAETAMKLPKPDAIKDDDLRDAFAALSFKRDAETIAGTKVHQLKFDVTKSEDLDDEDIEQLNALLGSDGVMIRAGTAGRGNAVITFGGGSTYFGSVVEQAKSKSAPLDGEPGIQAVNKHLPKERASVAYFDVDRIVNWISVAQKAVDEDEEPFPVKMPSLDAPFVIVSTGGKAWQTSQFYVPMDLMVAIKDAVMGAMSAADDTANDANVDGASAKHVDERR